MGLKKKVHSFWDARVRPLGVTRSVSRVVNKRHLTAAVYAQYGSKLVVLNDSGRELEHCGVDVSVGDLRRLRPGKNHTDNSAPAVRELYTSAVEAIGTPEPEVTAPEPEVIIEPEVAPEPEVVVEPVVEPVVEAEAPAEVKVEEPAEVVAEEAPKPKAKRKPRAKKAKATTKVDLKAEEDKIKAAFTPEVVEAPAPLPETDEDPFK